MEVVNGFGRNEPAPAPMAYNAPMPNVNMPKPPVYTQPQHVVVHAAPVVPVHAGAHFSLAAGLGMMSNPGVILVLFILLVIVLRSAWI